MIGFKLNKQTNDIEAINGKISLLATVQEAVRQRLDIKFKTWQGEWFLNTTYGIPYRQSILGKGRTKAEVDAVFVSEINADPDVTRIIYFNSVYDPIKRDYKLDFEVMVDDKPLRIENVRLSASDEILYPEPDNYEVTSECQAEVPEDYVDPFYFDGDYIMSFRNL